MNTREVIKKALRNIGVLSQDQEPSPSQANDALAVLNSSLIGGMFGKEIGPRLEAISFTASATGVYGGMYQCALSAIATLTFPANPKDGWRIGFTDQKANFNTYNLTVNPNSRLISTAVGTYSASNQTMSTNSTTKTYFFRSDAGWTEEQELTLDDTPYFPVDMHSGLGDMLAVLMHTEYFGASEAPSPALAAAAERGRALFVERYGARTQSQIARGLVQA
jgi:hypothetical protein